VSSHQAAAVLSRSHLTHTGEVAGAGEMVVVELSGSADGEGLSEARAPEGVRGLKVEAVPVAASTAAAAAASAMVERIEAAGRDAETEQGSKEQKGKSLFRVHERYLRVGFSRV
jgi:hypothetical protein